MSALLSEPMGSQAVADGEPPRIEDVELGGLGGFEPVSFAEAVPQEPVAPRFLEEGKPRRQPLFVKEDAVKLEIYSLYSDLSTLGGLWTAPSDGMPFTDEDKADMAHIMHFSRALDVKPWEIEERYPALRDMFALEEMGNPYVSSLELYHHQQKKLERQKLVESAVQDGLRHVVTEVMNDVKSGERRSVLDYVRSWKRPQGLDAATDIEVTNAVLVASYEHAERMREMGPRALRIIDTLGRESGILPREEGAESVGELADGFLSLPEEDIEEAAQMAVIYAERTNPRKGVVEQLGESAVRAFKGPIDASVLMASELEYSGLLRGVRERPQLFVRTSPVTGNLHPEFGIPVMSEAAAMEYYGARLATPEEREQLAARYENKLKTIRLTRTFNRLRAEQVDPIRPVATGVLGVVEADELTKLPEPDMTSFDVRDSEPLTGPEAQRAIDKLNETLSRDKLGWTARLLEPGTFGRSQRTESARLARGVAALFGRRVVIFETDYESAPNAIVNSSIAARKIIFLNNRADRPHLLTIGHELFHHIEISAPSLARKLMDELAPLVANWDAVDREKANYPANRRFHEVVADLFGSSFADTNFWEGLANRNPDLFSKIASIVKKWLTRVIDVLKRSELRGNRHFTDLEKTKTVVADALDEFSRSPFSDKGKIGPYELHDPNQSYYEDSSIPFESTPFAKDVRDILDGTFDKSRMVEVSITPTILRSVGLKGIPLLVKPSVIEKIALGKHKLDPKLVMQVPQALHRPIAVFVSDTRPGDSVVIAVGLKHDGMPVIVAVAKDQLVGRARANVVTSVYAKGRPEVFQKWIDEGKLLYSDPKKAPDWFQSIGVQFPKEGADQAGGNLGKKP